jgi:hypothetical protein
MEACTGSRPSGLLNPKATEAMRERGYDLSAHRSKSIARDTGLSTDEAKVERAVPCPPTDGLVPWRARC